MLISSAAAAATPKIAAQTANHPEQIFPGVFRFRLGTPERITPVSTRRITPSSRLQSMAAVAGSPVPVSGRPTRRGYVVEIPLAADELVYGLGLQLKSFIQRGLKKKLRVNADPNMDSGDSHAPVPFYLTTRGYGVLIDTARYLTIYAGNKPRRSRTQATAQSSPSSPTGSNGLPAAYQRYNFSRASEVIVEIPEAQGVDVYVFAGPTMRNAVQRYNQFSGGGALPPRWGLGVWYRAEKDFSQSDILRLADDFRSRQIPCDVIGLEPGWQTHSYSCSFVWSEKFPDPAAMMRKLAAEGFRINLWEHAFTHPSSPLYEPL